MTPELYQRAVRLFEAAVELPAANRVSLLEQQCGDSAELRKKVEEMLAADSRSTVLASSVETLAGRLWGDAAQTDLTGSRLGHYKLISKLGQGGMGVVYLAEDTRLGRNAAIKLLPEEFANDETWIRNFQHEARTVSALNHPNILTIYGLEEAGDSNYLATEYAAGPTIRERKGAFAIEELLDITRQLASGLAAAHRAGVIHRDLKPENIILREDGLVKILDFGLAKSAGDQEQSIPGTIKGTPNYMSPEQASGNHVDARSDIFSFGVVLYEMLTGQKPFAGSSPRHTLARVIHEPARAISELRPDAPAGLRMIIERALEKKPAQRYASMEAVLDDLGCLRQRNTGFVKWAAAAVLIVVAVAAFWRGPSPSAPRGIAVLPLHNLSGDATQQYFAEGLTEQLITDLSKVSALHVVSLASVLRYADGKTELPRISKELGADLILTGSVAKGDRRVRISAQLIQMPEQKTIWAESYDRALQDVLTLQSEVAKSVAGSVRIKLTPQEQTSLASVHTTDPETNELYLQGRFFANKTTQEGLEKGIEYFRRAIERDPKFANAYAGLSFSYSGLANFYVAPAEVMPRAKQAAEHAIELDPTLAEPHALLGLVNLYYEWDWDRAETDLKTAVSLSPSSALAHLLYEDMLLATGRFEEALLEAEKSMRADPLSIRALSEAQFANLLAGKNDKAIELGRKVAEIEPLIGIGHVYSGLAYAELKDLNRATQELETAVRLEPTVMAKGFLAHVRALKGDRAGALQLLEELKQINAKRYVCAFEIALGYATLGEKDEAFRMLNEGMKHRADCMVWLKAEPWLRSLSSDSRFTDLAAKVGLR